MRSSSSTGSGRMRGDGARGARFVLGGESSISGMRLLSPAPATDAVLFLFCWHREMSGDAVTNCW